MSIKDLLFNHLIKSVSISSDQIDHMIRSGRLKLLKKKDCLFKEGEVAKYVGYITKGCLKYYQIDDKGEEQIVYFAIEDWWIGDLNSFYSGKPSTYYLQALEDTELLLFTKVEFDQIRKDIPAFDEFCKIRHAKATDARMETLISQRSESAEERYLKLLQKIPDIFQRVPQHLIATYLGIKPPSLSRIRKQLTEKKK
ncbi:MAG: Crp/Fnr family transcriptional regulator [Saprospiraceae bacterium]